MSNYADIADLSWDQIQDTVALPVGTYLLKLTNAVFQPAPEEGKSPKVMLVHSVKEAMDDVDSEELGELKGAGGGPYDVTENKVFTTIFIEDGSSWKKVAGILGKHTGVELTGKVLDDFKRAKGSEVLGYLTKNRFERKDKSVGENNNVTEWAPVDGGE